MDRGPPPFSSFLSHLHTSLSSHRPLIIAPGPLDRGASVAAIFRICADDEDLSEAGDRTLVIEESPVLPTAADLVQSTAVRAHEPQLLFLKRAINPRDRWSGNVAFPGGKNEQGETPYETAVRETREEVGLDLERNFVCLGRLDDRKSDGRAASSLIISPFDSWPPADHQAADDGDSRRALGASLHSHPTRRRLWGGSLLTRLYALLGAEHVSFPSLLLPARPRSASALLQSESAPSPSGSVSVEAAAFEYKLWGLTLAMTSELLCAGGHPEIRLETDSALVNFYYGIWNPHGRARVRRQAFWSRKLLLFVLVLLAAALLAWRRSKPRP